MSDMVKYRAVSFKKDQIAALYSTMLIVHFYLVVNYIQARLWLSKLGVDTSIGWA